MSACAMYDIIMCIILALILVQNVLQIYSEVACYISSNTNLSAWNRYETSVVSSNSPTVSNSKIPTVSFHSTPHACIQGDRGAITFGSDGLVYVTTIGNKRINVWSMGGAFKKYFKSKYALWCSSRWSTSS